MKKITALLLTVLLLLSFAACSSNPTEELVESVLGGSDNKGTVSGSYNGSYVYNPPVDNYHIAYSEGAIEEARVGDRYSYMDGEEDGYSYNVDYSKQEIYMLYEGDWYLDTEAYWEDYEDSKDDAPYIFGTMEEYLIKYLKAFGTEDDELGEELKKYYIGDETVCGIKCWGFDSNGINTICCRFWIDPSNGAVLKYEWYDEAEVDGDEVTVYDLNYTELDKSFYPADYDSVIR